ncbi:MAG: hypothetical protein LBH25_14635, partial [Fibromonadaceae bacterium]|nr:hypothetical protein [Fibromonadaceae bacterium]
MTKITAHTANTLRFNRIAAALVMLALAAFSQGCSNSHYDSTLSGFGFASDTTAILLYKLSEYYPPSPIYIGSNTAVNNYGWELRLVDVRFNKVYWKAQIDHNNSEILRAAQWNDSTLLIELNGKDYWLWTVGNKKPQKVSFNWNAEENYHTSHLKIRSWKDNYVLLFFDNRQFIIDTQTMTVNDWSPTGENAWTVACDDFWWGKNGEACLKNKPYGFTLLSKEGDTLGNFTYAHECATYHDRKCDIKSSFHYNFIRASLGKCENDVCRAYPVKRTINVESHALIRYDSEWNIDKEPSFWM